MTIYRNLFFHKIIWFWKAKWGAHQVDWIETTCNGPGVFMPLTILRIIDVVPCGRNKILTPRINSILDNRYPVFHRIMTQNVAEQQGIKGWNLVVQQVKVNESHLFIFAF